MKEKKPVLLWLDDIRDPNTQTWAYAYSPIPIRGAEIVWVRSYEEFVGWISRHGLPEAICFDHDLSDIHCSKSTYKEKTGYDAAKWLTEYCMDHKLPLPKYGIQSANPVGRKNIDSLLRNFLKHHQ